MILRLTSLCTLITLFAACGSSNGPNQPSPGVDASVSDLLPADQAQGDGLHPDSVVVDAGMAPTVTTATLNTSLGKIVIELDEKKAPISSANFLAYVDKGHYTGTIFHRVIPGFMVQGGGYNETYSEKPTDAPITNEAGNGLKNLRGTLAMARTSVVNSATSQFFINVVDNSFLDHKDETNDGFGYAVFGKVIEGMEVVDAMTLVSTGAAGPFAKDVPKTAIVIQSASR